MGAGCGYCEEHMIRNLLFDWSGTVADDLPSVLRAVNGMLRASGREELTRAEFRTRFRLPYTDFFKEMLPGIPLERLQQLYLEHFPHAHEGVTLLPHAAEFIRYAAATGRRMVVLSSAPTPHVEAQAVALGVAGAGAALVETTATAVRRQRPRRRRTT
jgi:phosphoglycolate phosphatase-like HAD superfamily hydrolase